MGAIKPLQLTLAIIKPHIVSNPIALNQIKSLLLSCHFKIVRSERKTLTQPFVESFYSEHKDKFFYNRLVTFMVSGSLELYILARENAITEWRNLMGPTKVFKTQFSNPQTIRGMYGLSDTRNATHGSDSEESARREIKIFFPDFDIDEWYKNEESLFKTGEITFDSNRFMHVLNTKNKNKAII